MSRRLLTPVDVRQATFRTHRFREGYDTDEVDDFMDSVAETIERLASQVQALQTDLEKHKTVIGKFNFTTDKRNMP